MDGGQIDGQVIQVEITHTPAPVVRRSPARRSPPRRSPPPRRAFSPKGRGGGGRGTPPHRGGGGGGMHTLQLVYSMCFCVIIITASCIQVAIVLKPRRLTSHYHHSA